MPDNMKHTSVEAVALRSGPPLFNTFELRLFRYTAVLLSLVVMTMLIGVTLWSFGRLLGVFYNLLLSLSLAGILALVLYPLVQLQQCYLHFPRLLAIAVVLLVFFMAIGSLIVFLVPTLVSQAVQLMSSLPDTMIRWHEHFSLHFPELSTMISARFQNGSDKEFESILPGWDESGKTILSYLGILAGIGFVPLFLFFALLSGDGLRKKAAELFSVFHQPTQQKMLYFIDVFVGFVTAFFQGQLIIAVCMGILYAISFSMLGLEYGVLAGVVLGLLNIIPFLGTLIGLVVILPMAYLQSGGGIELMVLAGVVFAIVQVIESWILTPKIMANRSGLHPALVVISLFFWGSVLGGIIGMVLAVPLTAFFVAIWGEIKASLQHAFSSQEVKP
ncbi:AI-2E family transporter [Alkalimonas sp.]|uniref:AI-2E family transporter n=1 Tax=Alkalimonas sp. TaxID=1872453 RepID=UPI00263B405C|nr:AI-2E family transporter [Alkalimonas sp.]MCC5827362.1 AI-2E family transporter [Alkalimonas sp.]